MPKKPDYVLIAEALRAEVLAGAYDSEPLPSNARIAKRFDGNMETADRAIGHLVAQGLVLARPGMRAVAAPAELRAPRWPMTGRYARARAAEGLLFAGDVAGQLRKDTVLREWTDAPIHVAQLLGIDLGARVLSRHSRTFIDDRPTEETSMFFPADIVRDAPRLETEDRLQVVAFIEAAGHVVTRTANEIRARQANDTEQELFGIPLGAVVLEHSHGTFGAQDEPLEAVINVRPAADGVITFDTYEGPTDTTDTIDDPADDARE